MQKKDDKNDMRAYRSGPLTVIELLIVLAVLGMLLTWILQRFYVS